MDIVVLSAWGVQWGRSLWISLVDELKVIRESLLISTQFFMRAVPLTDMYLYYVAVDRCCLPAQSSIKWLCL